MLHSDTQRIDPSDFPVSPWFRLWILAIIAAAFLPVSACATAPPPAEREEAPTTAQPATPIPVTPSAAQRTAAATAAPVSAAATPTAPPPASQEPASGSAPAPAPVGTVVYYEDQVVLPTYPLEPFQERMVDPTYAWPYMRFDYDGFRQAPPGPEPRTYQLLVLENAYLRVKILPELGGRIWQIEHKPTGMLAFYQNSVVKPSPWGPAQQQGWLGVGGLEWNLPVNEHGYAWGETWGYMPLQHSPELASVTLFTPQDGRKLSAGITVSLFAGAASLQIEPTISNVSGAELAFDYWHTAQLAPGPGNQPSAELHFILPTDRVTVHSTQDPALPPPGESMEWPIADERDWSRLGAWREYAGFFEAPAAHGPFSAVYDPAYDAGVARIFPADVVRGSKIFAPGWQSPLDSSFYTDDSSLYVEMHGGLAATFDQRYTLPAGGRVAWREVWYPVFGIGDLTVANEALALFAGRSAGGLAIGLYPTRPMNGNLVVLVNDVERRRIPIDLRPDRPYQVSLPEIDDPAGVTVHVVDGAGNSLLRYALP